MTRPNPSPAENRRQALRAVDKTGTMDGVHPVMARRFEAKGYVVKAGKSWTLTKWGKAVMEGRIGKAGRGAVDMGSARHRAERGWDGRRRKATGSNMGTFMSGDGVTGRKRMEKDEKAIYEKEGDRLKAEWEKERAPYQAALAKILGTEGVAKAVKISRADGSPFQRQELENLQNAGWVVRPGGTIAAHVGKTLKGLRPDFNPTDPLDKALGPEGETRAVVLVADGISEETLHQLRGAGYDISAAPKRIREGIPVRENPTAKRQKRPRAATPPAKPKQAGTMKAKLSKKAPTKGKKATPKVAKKTSFTPEKFTLTGRFNPSSADDLARVWSAWTGTDPDQTLTFEVDQPSVVTKGGGRVTIPERVVVLGRVAKFITSSGRLADFGTKGPLMVTDAKAERVWLLADKPYHFDLEPSVIAYLARKQKFGDQELVEYVHGFKGRVRAVMAGQIGAMTGGFRITPRGLED